MRSPRNRKPTRAVKGGARDMRSDDSLGTHFKERPKKKHVADKEADDARKREPAPRA